MKRVLQRPPVGVARTAILIAAARANEQRQARRLFDDPLAAPLAEAAGPATDLSMVRNIAGEHFVLRTRYFDDYFAQASLAGCRQVVILAAGLDTRAFRIAWPYDTTVFEIDLPDLLDFKQEELEAQEAKPTCERVVVPADLREDWPDALLEAGFDPSRPTAWLLEGLLMFLPVEAGELLMRRIDRLSAPGGRLAMEHVNRAFRELPQMRPVHDRFDQLNAMWQSDLEDPLAWLSGHGWRGEITHQVELARRHRRPVPAITDPVRVGTARIWLASAVRKHDRYAA